MKLKPFAKTAAAITAFVVIALAGTLIRSKLVSADNYDDHRDRDEARIRRGFEISPVPLNPEGKNRDLVGLGSYLVNGVASCNDCHSAGTKTQYAPGGNPYFGSQAPGEPDIVSRNLTPDKTGLPEGGRTFKEFLKIMRTGVDLDHLHPNCSATVTTNCFTPPFDGDLLQIMPWPNYRHLSEHDLRAIYEYLREVPCIEGPPAPSVLHNDCQ
jgi:hypothetical protein